MAEEEKLVAGCLCGKTVQECGDCQGLVAHQEATLQRSGWCAPSEAVYGFLGQEHPFEFPKVQVKRGGIFYPRYRVETMVQRARKRFLRRQMWQLHVRYWDPAHQKNMHHVMIFASEHDANNAEQIIKFTVKNINEQVHQEQQNAR